MINKHADDSFSQNSYNVTGVMIIILNLGATTAVSN